MKYEEIIKAWNNQADKHNRWSDLGDDEMLEFAVCLEREACAALAEKTVCDTHIPTGINIYGTRAAKVIRARGKG